MVKIVISDQEMSYEPIIYEHPSEGWRLLPTWAIGCVELQYVDLQLATYTKKAAKSIITL